MADSTIPQNNSAESSAVFEVGYESNTEMRMNHLKHQIPPFAPSRPKYSSESLQYSTEEERMDNLQKMVDLQAVLGRNSEAMQFVGVERTKEEFIKFLDGIWEEFESDEFSSSPEMLKEQMALSFMEINAFLKQAATHVPSRPLSKEEQSLLQEDISLNIEKIWADNMKSVPEGETIFLTEVLERMTLAYVTNAKKKLETPEGREELKQYLLSVGGTEEQFDEMMAEYTSRVAPGAVPAVDGNIPVESAFIYGNVSEQKGLSDTSAKKGDILLTTNTESIPISPTFSANDYRSAKVKWVLREASPAGSLKYLSAENGIKEPFAEVIAFKNGSVDTLSLEAYRSMVAMTKDTKRKEKREKYVDRKVTGIQRKYTRYENKGKEDPTGYQSKQKELMASDEMYQLAMYDIAKNVESLVGEDVDKFVYSADGGDVQEQAKRIQSQKLDGYSVKNHHTDNADGSLDAQYAGRLTVENLILDQGVRSMGLLMVVANVLVGIRSGQWGAVAPYIAVGGGVTYALGQGVLNSGLDKIRSPDKMLDNILKESFGNEHYASYFGNEWEMALAKAIQWPDADGKNEMKQDLRAVKKSQEKKYLVHKDGRKEKLSSINPQDRKLKKRFEQTVGVGKFEEGCALEKYLPDGNIAGPDGNTYTKSEFLKRVKENEGSTEMNPHIRYTMMEKMAGRIGKKDSFLPYLNQLHGYYNKDVMTADISQKLQSLKTDHA